MFVRYNDMPFHDGVDSNFEMGEEIDRSVQNKIHIFMFSEIEKTSSIEKRETHE